MIKLKQLLIESLPLNSYGQVDIRNGVPQGFIHIPGKRLSLTCKALTFNR